MATEQAQQPGKPQVKQKKQLSQRKLIIATTIVIALAIATIWILSSLGAIPNSWAAISSIIVATFGAVFTFLQSLHLFLPLDTHQPHSSQIPSIIVQLPKTQILPLQSTSTEKLSYRGILGLPPPTDPKSIQQRKDIVKEVYKKLTQPEITAIVLTGIGGVGKSTLAALTYRYSEERRSVMNGPFLAEALWLTVDPAVTFADLAGNLFEALGKPLPDLSSLAPQNQAVALFNALNTTERPRLIILDQFENLLDWGTGHALADRPGVGEWLDNINSHQCFCRILLTSRPRPVGTRELPSIHLQEYSVGGLSLHEGIALLRSQNVQGTELELQTAVSHCAGHAFSLMLLASLVRDHHMNLSTLFKNSELWSGDIATNILNQLFTDRLNNVQRELLLAFSVYREPIPLEPTLVFFSNSQRAQVSLALKTLLTQHLLEAVGEGRYQPHTIIAEYVQSHFNEQSNEEALPTAHAKAAQYYLEQAVKNCPPRGQRRRVSDVHDLIEAIWQWCQAEKWQEAYDLMEREGISDDLKRWGGNAVLLELYQLLLPLEKWQQSALQPARIYNNLGEVYSALGQKGLAQNYFERALSICRSVENREEEGVTLNNLDEICRALGKKNEARKYLEEALIVHREVGNGVGEGRALNNLGEFYLSTGKADKAQEYLESALTIRREVKDRAGEGRTLNNLGELYTVQGKTAEAQKYLEEALSIRREIGDLRRVCRTLNNLGQIYIVQGKMGAAQEYMEEALRNLQEIGDYWGVGSLLSNLGGLYLLLGQTEKARLLLEESLKIHREIGFGSGVARTFNKLGRSYYDQGKTLEAQRYYEQALTISREVEDQKGEGVALDNLGGASAKLRKTDEAQRYYEQALTIWRKIGERDREGMTNTNLGRLYLRLGMIEEAWKYLKKALLILRNVDCWGEGLTLLYSGALYFEQHRYDVALAFFLLAKEIIPEIPNPYRDRLQKSLDAFYKIFSQEQLTALIATIGPDKLNIVEQTLNGDSE